MLVQVPPKRRPKIHGVTSQQTVRNLVCCYVYINLINVTLVLTRRIKWTRNRLQQTREDKNTQNVMASGHQENRDDREKIPLKHV